MSLNKNSKVVVSFQKQGMCFVMDRVWGGVNGGEGDATLKHLINECPPTSHIGLGGLSDLSELVSLMGIQIS